MDRMKDWIIKQDQQWFYVCNTRPKSLIKFSNWITHLGGATFTISFVLTMLFLSFYFPSLHLPATIAAGSLTMSHIIVVCVKKIVRRIRPYLFLPDATVHGHPFQDHSFPSGHTTAIFSITVPFMVVEPLLLLFLLPISMMVAFSRVVLGVHYPTDTAVGALIGTLSSFVVAMLLV